MNDRVNLHLARIRLHMSTTEMGNELGVSDRTIREWEGGHGTIPSGVVSDLEQLLLDYEAAIDALIERAHTSPYTVQIYRGYVKGNLGQCPPPTWLGIIAEAYLDAPQGSLKPVFPEDGTAELKVMPFPLRGLSERIKGL